MRRIKKLAIVAVVLVVVMVATGCGCACDTSGSSGGNDQNTTSGQNTGSNNGKVDDGKSNTKTANSDFEPTISVEQRKAVKAEDYINGNTFDLTAYAEALGFTHLTDPSYPEIAFYAIRRGNTYCLFSYGDPNIMVAWFDTGDGYVYRTSAEALSVSPEDYIIKSKNQKDRPLSKDVGLDYIEKAMKNISTVDEINFENLPGFTSVEKHAGPAAYLPNGLLKVREIGGLVDSVKAHGHQ